MKEKTLKRNDCNILLKTFVNLEKYVYSKKGLKQGSQPPPKPLPPAKSKVFSRPKSHLTTAVICNLKGYFRQPGNRKTYYFKSVGFLNNCHKS